MAAIERSANPLADDHADVACVTVEAACNLLSIGKTTFYQIVDQLDTFKIGTRRLVRVESIRRLVTRAVDADRRALAKDQAL